MTAMPIDLATVDWLYVVVLALFVFVATLIANVLSFGRHIARRRAVGGAVRGGLRVLDLLPAPLAAADRAHAAEGRGDDGARAGRSGRANAAAQSGDGYHAARRSGFSAAGRRAGKSAPCALGLRPTV